MAAALRRRQPDAEAAEDHRLPGRHAGHGQEHADDRGEYDQGHHAWLGQFEILLECDRHKISGSVLNRFRALFRLTQTRQQANHHEQQQGGAGVMRHSHPQRQGIHHIADAQRHLRQNQQQQQAAPVHQARRADQFQRDAQQVQRHDHRHAAVHKLDGDPRRTIQYAAFVIHADAAPKHQGFAEIMCRQPLAVAGREVGAAGQGRVIGAGPAA